MPRPNKAYVHPEKCMFITDALDFMKLYCLEIDFKIYMLTTRMNAKALNSANL